MNDGVGIKGENEWIYKLTSKKITMGYLCRAVTKKSRLWGATVDHLVGGSSPFRGAR